MIDRNVLSFVDAAAVEKQGALFKNECYYKYGQDHTRKLLNNLL